jgi:hypothetical protein
LISGLPRIIRILHEEADVRWKENKTPLGTFLSVPRLEQASLSATSPVSEGGAQKSCLLLAGQSVHKYDVGRPLETFAGPSVSVSSGSSRSRASEGGNKVGEFNDRFSERLRRHAFPVERAFVGEYALFIAGEYGEIAVAPATFLWLWGTQF